ncbi:DUF6283 family protein [Nocardia gamkensis]|uniref:DUF6283 family protein n=1 Tax=Nocardia gamkensis TaxID=352869 RepID=UPI00340E589D
MGYGIAWNTRKLRDCDGELAEQSPALFQCHRNDADSRRRICVGCVGCHGGRELLALRLALIRGPQPGSPLQPGIRFTPVPRQPGAPTAGTVGRRP